MNKHDELVMKFLQNKDNLELFYNNLYFEKTDFKFIETNLEVPIYNKNILNSFADVIIDTDCNDKTLFLKDNIFNSILPKRIIIEVKKEDDFKDTGSIIRQLNRYISLGRNEQNYNCNISGFIFCDRISSESFRYILYSGLGIIWSDWSFIFFPKKDRINCYFSRPTKNMEVRTVGIVNIHI